VCGSSPPNKAADLHASIKTPAGADAWRAAEAASLCDADLEHPWAVGLSAPRSADRVWGAVARGSSWPDDAGEPVIVPGSRLPINPRNVLPTRSCGRTGDRPGPRRNVRASGCSRQSLAPMLPRDQSACQAKLHVTLGLARARGNTMQHFKVAVLMLGACGWTDVRAACSRRLAVPGAGHPEVSGAANELWMRSAVNLGPTAEVARGGNWMLVRHSA